MKLEQYSDRFTRMAVRSQTIPIRHGSDTPQPAKMLAR